MQIPFETRVGVTGTGSSLQPAAARTGVGNAFRFSVAPMMDWTDRHCRYFHRLITRNALLYTEMISSAALVRGRALWLLDHRPDEHPVALQLGGADPHQLAEATRIGVDAGFDEINLNVGCPSDRVRDGCFGAVLMTRPMLVEQCLSAMVQAAGETEVTLKCRIGVDDQVPEETLPAFLEIVARVGVKRVSIHARKAWLSGLSPKQNRNIPPLDHDLVLAMKSKFPELRICLNGGISSLDEVERYIGAGIDGVMVGRAAYRSPFSSMADVDRRIFGDCGVAKRSDIARRMLDYIQEETAKGERVHRITRHMMGLYSGCRGAKMWRRALSDSPKISQDGSRYLLEVIQGMADQPHEPVN